MIIQQQPQQNLIFLPNNQMTVILQNKKGSGAQGAVYQGFIKNKNEQVAIKIVKSLDKREAQILEQIKQLKQKHIIKIYAIENLQNQVIIVMELAEMDFYQFIKTYQFRTSDINERNQLFLQMIQGVYEFHNLNLFHRDLKPENFVCCRDQNQNLIIKLIDFGISKIQEEDGVLQSMNVGTPYYMAREVLNNQGYSKAIDVWAMGVIWYEILTEKTFIEGNNAFSIINQICTISQTQIDLKIDQLDLIQKEQKDIMKQMICIDKKNRISIDEAMNKINDFLKKQQIEKIEAMKLVEIEKQIILEYQRKNEEFQQQQKLETENQIELLKYKLKSEYDQQIEQKEIELRKIIQQQQPLLNQNQKNIEEQKLQWELQFQTQMNEFKKQCELDYQQKLEQKVELIQFKQRDSFEKKIQIEDQEIKNLINKEAQKLYQIELKQQLETENQQKKEQFHINKQNYIYIINLLKDTIQNAIFSINQQISSINNLQLQNQDKHSILNSIQKFINDKEQELNQINQDENTFNTLDENQQFTKFLDLETKYKNQVQIHIEEKNMMDQQINKFMIDQFQRLEQIPIQDKQKQNELQNQQIMNNQKQNYEMLKNQYNESQKQIENIKTICETYSKYNQNIHNGFKRLKENSNKIAQNFNQVQQYYQSLENNNINLDQINFIKLNQLEIHNQIQRLQENIIYMNESISTYEEELKLLMQSHLTQIQDKAKEIEYKINYFKNRLYRNDDPILSQLQTKQELMNALFKQLDKLIQIQISQSINEFMQIKQTYAKEEQIVKDLSEKLLYIQQNITTIKLMSEQQQNLLMIIESQSNQQQQQIQQLITQLLQIQNDCEKLENKEIKELLNKKQNELNEMKQIAKQKFDGLLIRSKQKLESQQMLNQLKDEYNTIQFELQGKQEEQMKQIMQLNNQFDQIFKIETDQKLQKINQDLSFLIQDFKTKQIELINFDVQNYTYKEIIEQQKIKSEKLNEQQIKIENETKIFLENDNVINEELEKAKQSFLFQENQKMYISRLENIKKKTIEKFNNLLEISEEIKQQTAKIQFIELESQHQIQQQWTNTKQYVIQLNNNLNTFQQSIKVGQKFNDNQINSLCLEFENLKCHVQNAINYLPQKKDIIQFQNKFDTNNKSYLIICSLIIMMKAYNIKRYVQRLKEFQEKQQQKQSQQIVQLKKLINDMNQNSESRNQKQIELQKLEQKKIILIEEVEEYELQAKVIIEKYQQFLKSKEFQIKREDYNNDEDTLDKQMIVIQNHINSLNSVKLRSTIRDQEFNKEFRNQFYNQLEFSKIIGLNQIYQHLNLANK